MTSSFHTDVRLSRRTMIGTLPGGMLLATMAPEICVAAGAATQSAGYRYLPIRDAEDFAPLMSSKWLIASSKSRGGNPPAYVDAVKGAVKFDPGGIYAIDRRSKAYVRLWPNAAAAARRDPRYADFSTPPRPATFSCSGLHLAHGKDGVHTLYAVDATERNAIEIFELAEGRGAPSLTWVGAVRIPSPCRGNSVCALPDGSLVLTVIQMHDDPDAFTKIKAGANTGYLLRWHPSSGWGKIASTESSGPNGVLASPDGATLYFACSGGKHMVVMSTSGNAEGRKVVDFKHMPDNLRWGDRGRIWVGGVSDLGSSVPAICSIDPTRPVPDYVDLPSSVGKFSHCSVAIEINREIWLGSFYSDNMAVLTGAESVHSGSHPAPVK